MLYNISHSEVQSFSCERKWLYAHHPSYNLESTRTQMGLLRGNIGHEALQEYYNLRMNGVDHATAAVKAKTVVMMHIFKQQKEGNAEVSEELSNLINLLTEYFEYYESDIENWEILGVEQYFEVEPDFEARYKFAGKIDLVVRIIRGKFAGEIMPIDHKFVYDFWNERALDMDSQLPKYIYALRKMYPGERIKRAMVNQLRHRTLKRAMEPEERFLRSPRVPEVAELQSLMDNHWAISERISNYLDMQSDAVERTVTRSLSKFNCENCSFARLCKADMRHDDTTLMRRVEYQKNSYGYREL